MKITGKDLIEMGYRQGKWFKNALIEVNRLRLMGEELTSYLDQVAPQISDPHAKAVSFHQNLRSETPAEEANVQKVIDTMYGVMKTPTVVDGAVMPDACPAGPAGQIPVGGVVVAKNAIHPAMHSADICCSVMATSMGFVPPKKVLDAAHSITHFGGGGRQELFELPTELEDCIRANYFLKNVKSRHLANTQLGTQGDGNHFLSVGQSERTGETIMVTHHGSRGFGASLYKEGLKKAEVFRREISPKTLKVNAWIPYSEPEGKAYWEALQIVRAWTKLNHEVLHEATCQLLNIDPYFRFWNEHNFVFKEEDRFFHAKGATPLSDNFVPDSEDGLRLVPLNMSEPILIIKGERTPTNLGFAPHGAGRDISRSMHIRQQSHRSIEDIFVDETKGLDVRFFSGHIDISELPSAYKNADRVQRQIEEYGLGEVKDRILPYGCIMAGNWKIDAPWRKRNKGK